MPFDTWALRWQPVPGEPVAEVQARLGQSTPRAAMLYQHSTTERQADIAAALSVMAESANPKISLDVK